MKIKFTTNYSKPLYLETDEHNFILHHGIEKNRFTEPKYYSTISRALNGVLTYSLLKSDIKEIKQVLKMIKDVKQQFSEQYQINLFEG